MLQAQDISKIGYMQDLIRGIDKLFGRTRSIPNEPSTINVANSTTKRRIGSKRFMIKTEVILVS